MLLPVESAIRNHREWRRSSAWQRQEQVGASLGIPSGLQIQIVSTFLDEVLVPLVTDR
jgi:hypothetical protein